jgi:hypothetical protein
MTPSKIRLRIYQARLVPAQLWKKRESGVLIRRKLWIGSEIIRAVVEAFIFIPISKSSRNVEGRIRALAKSQLRLALECSVKWLTGTLSAQRC